MSNDTGIEDGFVAQPISCGRCKCVIELPKHRSVKDKGEFEMIWLCDDCLPDTKSSSK